MHSVCSCLAKKQVIERPNSYRLAKPITFFLTFCQSSSVLYNSIRLQEVPNFNEANKQARLEGRTFLMPCSL